MDNIKEKWTFESVHPHMFTPVLFSNDGLKWKKGTLKGYDPTEPEPFLGIAKCYYRYMRLIPKPTVEQYTMESCPWPLHFKFVASGQCITALRKEENGVVYLDSLYRPRLITYLELSDWASITCLDGTPCGIVTKQTTE